MPDSPYSTIILSDEPLLLMGLCALLKDDPEFEVVAQADKTEDILRYARGHKPSLLVINAKDTGPLQVSQQILAPLTEISPHTKVVLISQDERVETARDTLRTGINGYVTIYESADRAREAMSRAVHGKLYVSPKLGVEMVRVADNVLTKRETEILTLIAKGYSSNQVSQELHLSVRTVESHRSSLMHSLGLTDRRDLVEYAIEHHLMS